MGINKIPQATEAAPKAAQATEAAPKAAQATNQIAGLTQKQIEQLLFDDPTIEREDDFDNPTIEREDDFNNPTIESIVPPQANQPDTTPDSLDPQTEHHQANKKFIKALQGQIADGNGGAIQELLIKTLQEENNTKTSPLHTAKLYTLVTLHLGSLGLKFFKNLIFGSKR